MKLGLQERIALLNILPAEGNVITLKIVNDLRREASFSEEELGVGKIKSVVADGQVRVTWDEDVDFPEKNVNIGPAAKEIVVKVLKRLDAEQKMTVSFLPLWDKFCVNEEA